MSLPASWSLARLDEAVDVILGQSPPGDTYNGDGLGLPFFQGKAEFGSIYPTVRKWCNSPMKIAEPEDILISVRAPVGPTNLCPERACIGRGLAAVRALAGMPTRYILYALRASEPEIAREATGSTFSAISGDQLRAHLIPIAPLPEQKRIVAEIEKQFTRLDDAVKALKRVQANLKRYRASVLKAACEGRLVPFKPGDKACLRDVLREPLANGRSPASTPTGAPILRLTSMHTDNIDLAEVRFGGLSKEQQQQFAVKLGDIFVSRGNGSIRFVGRASMVAIEPQGPVAFPDTMIRVRVREEACDPNYFLYVWNSDFVRSQIERTARTTAGIYKISQADIERIAIPLPSLAVQRKIVAALQVTLPTSDRVSNSLNTEFRRAAALRLTTLRSAFSGKLVPQYPSDEPAYVLLERIRAERIALGAKRENQPAKTKAGTVNGQRRRRIEKLAKGASPGKSSKIKPSAVQPALSEAEGYGTRVAGEGFE
jgi:type I restriction enzyme, S subunit